MKKIAAIAALLILSACSEDSQEHKEATGAAAPTKEEIAAQIMKDKASSDGSVQLSENDKAGCNAYGQMAAAMATDRQNGVPFSQQLKTIRANIGSVEMAKEMRNLANAIYNEPWANKMNPDGARAAFSIDCEMRIQKTRGGAKTASTREEIASELASFPATNGQKLPSLLRKYGLKIDYIEIVPIEALGITHPEDKPGDLLFSIKISGSPKPMPCGLHKWLRQGMRKGNAGDIAEIVSRNGAFLTDAQDLNPVLYWAATGKCSEAYGLPI